MSAARSPLRIRPFLEVIRVVWAANPDQRFGQLVMNLSRDKHGVFQDTWNWEDSQWQAAIDHYSSTASGVEA